MHLIIKPVMHALTMSNIFTGRGPSIGKTYHKEVA